MSKTILAQVDGWTPVIDGLVLEVGAVTALIFGKMWRYCQMSDGVCKAGQERIANELGISRQTINSHIDKLVAAGFMEDMTPDLLGLPHQYRDTGKANLSISLTATCQKSLHPPVKNFDTKKELKKDSKENDEALATISRAYESEIGVLTPMIADELQEAATAYPLKWTLDAIREAATNNKRGWKYVLAILARWKAQGNQEVMKPVGQAQGNASKRPASAYQQIKDILAEQKAERELSNVNV